MPTLASFQPPAVALALNSNVRPGELLNSLMLLLADMHAVLLQ
jgi:hypothetical protein